MKFRAYFKQYFILSLAAGLLLVAALLLWFSFRPWQNNPLSGLIEPADSKSQVVYGDKPVTLQYWRVGSADSALEATIADFKKLHPMVTIQLQTIDLAQYQAQLTQAAQAGTLPDMFSVNSDWLPRYRSYLGAAPSTVYSEATYREVFADVVAKNLITNGQIKGVSYGASTLGLFYNPSLLQAAGVEVPKNWTQFVAASRKLTQKTGATITQSGAALGTTNITRATDIEALLILQNGAQLTDDPPTRALFAQNDVAGVAVGAKAMDFYASFAEPAKANYSYQDALGSDIQAFAAGKAAFMINYPETASTLATLNPSLKYKTSTMPQVDGQAAINLAQFWVESVGSKSAHSEYAWDFLRFAATRDQQQRFNEAHHIPTSRKDLVEAQKSNAIFGPFVGQIISSQIFYKGNDQEMNNYFSDATISVLSGLDPQPAVRQAETRASNTIAQYPVK